MDPLSHTYVSTGLLLIARLFPRRFRQQVLFAKAQELASKSARFILNMARQSG